MNALPAVRVLVVEDEWPARNYLVELLEATQLVDVVGAVATVDEAQQALHAERRPAFAIDIVFVDIQLATSREGSEAGLRLVRSMAEVMGAPMFIVATAFKQHAVEAFELGVVDYVLKPFNRERIEQCVRRVLARRSLPQERSAIRRIVARRGKSIVFLELHEVWAFEAADRLTTVHTAGGVLDIDLTLASIEASFGRALVRVHRNWLVNSDHVKELERDGHDTRLFVGTGTLPDRRGVFVPVARDRAQSIRDFLLSDTTGLRQRQRQRSS
jgi:two-component system, LytTR family, response regulator LytT